jgi:hypothetical protein
LNLLLLSQLALFCNFAKAGPRNRRAAPPETVMNARPVAVLRWRNVDQARGFTARQLGGAFWPVVAA